MFLNARTLLLICWTSGCWAFSFGLGSQVVAAVVAVLAIWMLVQHFLNDRCRGKIPIATDEESRQAA